MRTSLRFIIIALSVFTLILISRASALTISTSYCITTDSTITEDVQVVGSGTLYIFNSVTVTFDPYTVLSFTDSSRLFAHPFSSIVMNDRCIIELSSTDSLFFDNSTTVQFLSDGQLALNSNMCFCVNTAFIVTPGYVTEMTISTATPLQGNASISGFFIVIQTPTWTITATDNILIDTYAYIRAGDPSISSSINVNGILTLDNAVFDFESDPAHTIVQIAATTTGNINITHATVHNCPPISGTNFTNIYCFDSFLYFAPSSGITSSGNMYFLSTTFHAFDASVGWAGITLSNAVGMLTMEDCKVRYVDCTTYPASVQITNSPGGVHTITRCSISYPMTQNAGYGVSVSGTAAFPTNCIIECASIQDHASGVYALNQSVVDIYTSEIIYNTEGCTYNSTPSSLIDNSMIALNIIGIHYIGATGNTTYHSSIINNFNYQILANANAASAPSAIGVSRCNLFNNIPGAGIFLLALFGNSSGVMSSTFWIPTPPRPGIDYFIARGSILAIASDTLFQHNVTGFTTCGMIYPKTIHARRNIPILTSPDITLTNYPNPFNPSTQIEYTIPEDMNVTLTLYSITGEYISTIDYGFRSKGTHTITYSAPSGLSSGMYLYTLDTPSGAQSRFMVLAK